MPVYTLYSIIHEEPLFTKSMSPYYYSICHYCKNVNNVRNLHNMIGPIVKNMKDRYVSYKFCVKCFDKYRIIRPSREELQYYIYKRYLFKLSEYINIHLPKYISLLICKFIKYPEE
jgi:hypothetical protein